MNSETTIIRIIALTFIAFVTVIGGCNLVHNYQDNNAIVKMVGDGADPLAARCAVQGDMTNTGCVLVISRR